MSAAAEPRVLLYSAVPKADKGGVQAVIQGLAAYLGPAAVTAWPDGEEGAREWRLDLTADLPDGLAARARTGKEALSGLMTLAKRLAAFRPDIVNLHFPRGQTLYFLLLRRVFGYKLVISLHGSDLLAATPAVADKLPSWLRQADRVTAVSAPLAEKVAALSPGSAPTVIPNGIDTAFWTPPEKAAPRSGLVAAGRLVTVKGYDVLLRALARLPETLRLTLCGEGEERAALEGLAAARGLEGRVAFTGRLGPEALRARLREAELYVLPSRSEGLPLGLMEALACGTPAAATAVGGVPGLAEPPALTLCPPDDPAALAEAIEAALEQDGTTAALRAAEGFSAETAHARYAEIFREAASCSP